MDIIFCAFVAGAISGSACSFVNRSKYGDTLPSTAMMGRNREIIIADAVVVVSVAVSIDFDELLNKSTCNNHWSKSCMR